MRKDVEIEKILFHKIKKRKKEIVNKCYIIINSIIFNNRKSFLRKKNLCIYVRDDYVRKYFSIPCNINHKIMFIIIVIQIYDILRFFFYLAALANQINKDFGSMQEMKKRLSEMTVAIQGSGWGWLGYDQKAKSLRIATCANQDPLQPTTGLIPLFGIDVWEHAYYLQYKNVRPVYVEAIFDIVNWKDVNARFKIATGC